MSTLFQQIKAELEGLGNSYLNYEEGVCAVAALGNAINHIERRFTTALSDEAMRERVAAKLEKSWINGDSPVSKQAAELAIAELLTTEEGI